MQRRICGVGAAPCDLSEEKPKTSLKSLGARGQGVGKYKDGREYLGRALGAALSARERTRVPVKHHGET